MIDLREYLLQEKFKKTLYLLIFLFFMGVIGYYSTLFTMSIKQKAVKAEQDSILMKQKFQNRVTGQK